MIIMIIIIHLCSNVIAIIRRRITIILITVKILLIIMRIMIIDICEKYVLT